MQCLLRLKKELERFQSQPPPGISCWQTDDCYQLKASVLGPDDTPYENGLFCVDIQVPERYPFVPPNVRFATPVYHPNIDDCGRICLDILKTPPQGSWKPSLNIGSILIAIQLLMAEPNFNDPLMIDIANEYQVNHSSFVEHAREHTLKYAIQQNTPKIPQVMSRFGTLQESTGFEIHWGFPAQVRILSTLVMSLIKTSLVESAVEDETCVAGSCKISCDFINGETPDAKRRKFE